VNAAASAAAERHRRIRNARVKAGFALDRDAGFDDVVFADRAESLLLQPRNDGRAPRFFRMKLVLARRHHQHLLPVRDVPAAHATLIRLDLVTAGGCFLANLFAIFVELVHHYHRRRRFLVFEQRAKALDLEGIHAGEVQDGAVHLSVGREGEPRATRNVKGSNRQKEICRVCAAGRRKPTNE
jgi:hypothetical protein